MTEPPDIDHARTCRECEAPLDERQEICVECGHAAGPRDRRRIRRALPTASLAAFAVLLGASAAYGLSAGGASNVRDLGIGPAKPAAPDTVASATPTPPPASSTTTPAAPVAPATATPPPSTPSTPSKAPKVAAAKPKPATTTPATTTPSSGSTGGTTPSSSSHHHPTPARTHHNAPATPTWFTDADQPPDVFVYDQAGAGAKEHPSQTQRANDGNMKTAWTTGNHSSGLRGSGVGLIVDTGKYQPYTAIGIATSTPGFHVSIYSSNDSKGSGNPAANGWKLEGKKAGVGKVQKIGLKGANDQPQYVLIWITKLPAGKSRTSISEIRLIL